LFPRYENARYKPAAEGGVMIWRGLLFCVALLTTGPCWAAATFKDCAECPEMIVIPPGTFKMGSVDGVLTDNERPQHEVTIGKAFAVGIHVVTFEQWDACVLGGGCDAYWPLSENWGRGNRPVIYVSWHDAHSYVRWLNERVKDAPEVGTDAAPDSAAASKSGPYRLLTEAEWEYAARAGTTTTYYWGESRDSGHANCDGCGSPWDNQQTSPVGSFAPNPFGLYDMAGNVLQWVEDCYQKTYVGAPTDGRAWKAGPCEARVMRGGSWFNSTYYIRSTQRYIVSPYVRANNAGFRVAKTLE